MSESEKSHAGESRGDQFDSTSATGDAMTVSRRASLVRSVWFVVKAIEIRLRFVAVLVFLGVVIGNWDTIKNYWEKWTRPISAEGAMLSGGEEFYCPMHPSVVRDQPDSGGATPKCPICGMPLSKRKKGELPQLPEGILSRVQLSPYRVQLAGIQTAEVTYQPMTLDIRTVGFVMIDERRLSRIVVRAAGYVEKLYVNESFAEVRQGDPLAEIYSPELYSAAQELLILRTSNGSQLAEIARDKLRLLGVADQEIDQIIRAGKADSRVIIRSPQSGHVFQKQIVEGDRLEAGQMLFEVVDLSTVWIEGEVFEKDAALLRRGQAVEVAVEAYPGRIFRGQVGLVHPHVEPSTRTLRVRFELDNPDHVLRPGMFATVSLKTPIQEIEPFASELRALRERIDSSQSELTTLDEEPLIALQKICPVTGAKLGSMGAPSRTTVHGHTLFLCCTGCQQKLDQQPEFYLSRLKKVSENGVLAVPEQAVVDTGDLKIVYVEREPGLFEGVAVTLGPRAGSYSSVIDGLLPGDRVAAAGAFLVDAETRLNPAAAAAYFGASGGPSSGAVSLSAKRATSTPGMAIEVSPDEMANLNKLSAADQTLALEQKLCPVGGEPLGSMGVPVKLRLNGETVFLCCEGCTEEAKRQVIDVVNRVRQLRSASQSQSTQKKKND